MADTKKARLPKKTRYKSFQLYEKLEVEPNCKLDLPLTENAVACSRWVTEISVESHNPTRRGTTIISTSIDSSDILAVE